MNPWNAHFAAIARAANREQKHRAYMKWVNSGYACTATHAEFIRLFEAAPRYEGAWRNDRTV